MPIDYQAVQREATELLAEALEPYGARGLVVVAPAGAWNAGDDRVIPVPGLGGLRAAADGQGCLQDPQSGTDQQEAAPDPRCGANPEEAAPRTTSEHSSDSTPRQRCATEQALDTCCVPDPWCGANPEEAAPRTASAHSSDSTPRQRSSIAQTMDTSAELQILRIRHDEREAPYALAADGSEDRDLLVSLSDEGSVVVCALALTAGSPGLKGPSVGPAGPVGSLGLKGLGIDLADLADSANCPSLRRPGIDPAGPVGSLGLKGLGIDLADPADFAGQRGERFNRLIFSPTEQRLAPTLADDEAMGYAFAFSAKEAAFKACSAPLRRWYDGHDEELLFDVTEFELVNGQDVRGTLRHAHAAQAMDAMGIRTHVVRRAICGLACTIAIAE